MRHGCCTGWSVFQFGFVTAARGVNMPDERIDSIRQGIHAPAESPSGSAAEREREELTSRDPEITGAMGGTTDSETAGEEADMEARRRAAEAEGKE